MLETPKTQRTEKSVTTAEIRAIMAPMDNQQASRRLGWFVGIIDGEGCFSICAYNKGDGRKSLRPLYSMSMTSENDVQKFVSIAQEHDIPIKSYRRKPPREAHYREQFGIYITGFARVKKLVELVQEELCGKRAQADLILEWINHRLAMPPAPGAGNSTHSELDWEYKNKLSDMKQTNRSATSLRDYTPSTRAAARERKGNDIVRPAAKSAEATSQLPA